MVDLARLTIAIDGSQIRSATQQLQGLAQKGTQVGRTMTTRLTLPLAAGMIAAVREAGMLEGALDKFNVVFQGMNTEMHEFVRLYNEEFPIARSEVVKHAAALQDLLVPMGINRKEAAGMTREWLELAGALSAFNDVPIGSVLEAMSSGIAGMTRPLRQFGIDARATVLEQVALEEGLIRVGEAMTEQARQQALLIQSYRQSQDALNGLEEQKGSLLWKIEELKRDFKDLLAILGDDLIPIATDLIDVSKDWIVVFSELDEGTKKTVTQLALLTAAAGPVIWLSATMVSSFITLGGAAARATKGVASLSLALSTNPWFLVAGAAGALALLLTGKYISSVNSAEQETSEFTEALLGQNKALEEAQKLLEGLSYQNMVNNTQQALRTVRQDARSLETELREDFAQVQEALDGTFSNFDEWLGHIATKYADTSADRLLALKDQEIALERQTGIIEEINHFENQLIATEGKRGEFIESRRLAAMEEVDRLRELIGLAPKYREALGGEGNLSGVSQAELRTVSQLKELIQDLGTEIENSFDRETVASYQAQIESLEREVGILLGTITPMSELLEKANSMELRKIEPAKLFEGFDDIEPPMKSVLELLRGLSSEQQHLILMNNALGDSYTTTSQQASLYLDAIDRLIKDGHDPQSKVVQELVDKYVKLQGELTETDALTQDLGFTFSSAFEEAAMNVRSLNDLLNVTQGLMQDILRIFLRTAVTKPLGDALANSFSGAFSPGGSDNAEPVDDLIISDSGRVFKPHPNDTLLAVQNLAGLTGGGDQKPANFNVYVENHAGAQVDVQRQQRPDGGFDARIIIKNTVKELIGSGALDRELGGSFGLRRSGRNVG